MRKHNVNRGFCIVTAILYMLVYSFVTCVGFLFTGELPFDPAWVTRWRTFMCISHFILPMLATFNLYRCMTKLIARNAKALLIGASCFFLLVLAIGIVSELKYYSLYVDGNSSAKQAEYMLRHQEYVRNLLWGVAHPAFCIGISLTSWLSNRNGYLQSNNGDSRMNLTNALLKHRKRLLVFDNFFILVHISWLGIWFFNLGDNSYQFILQYVMPVLTLLAILRLIYGIFLPKILTKRTEKTQIAE